MGRLLVALLVLSATGFGQSWDDLAEGRPLVADKLLVGTDKIITIQPPEGKIWIVTQGAVTLERKENATVLIFTEAAPYAPYRDASGKMVGCPGCVNITRADANIHTWVPVVGGCSATEHGVLCGQTMPIVIKHPNRLQIAVTPTHGGLSTPLMTWNRFTIVERDINPGIQVTQNRLPPAPSPSAFRLSPFGHGSSSLPKEGSGLR
jgi:hypothetical protein